MAGYDGKLSLESFVFDFDGTLAQLNIDFSLMRNVVIDLIFAYNIPLDGLKNLFVLEMIEAGRELICRCNPGKEIDYIEKANRLISNIEIEAAKKGKLVDGIRQMLAELKARDIKTGVVTRNCRRAVRKIFPDIDSFCNVVITRELTSNVKPHPQHLRIALEALDTAPEHSTMVGDHPMDISIGKEVGAYTIGVLTGCSDVNILHKAGADIIIKSAAEIVEYLP